MKSTPFFFILLSSSLDSEEAEYPLEEEVESLSLSLALAINAFPFCHDLNFLYWVTPATALVLSVVLGLAVLVLHALLAVPVFIAWLAVLVAVLGVVMLAPGVVPLGAVGDEVVATPALKATLSTVVAGCGCCIRTGTW